MSKTTLRLVPAGSERDAYLPLFHLADDSADQVLSYYETGTLFALNGPDGRPVGVVLAIDETDGSVELKAVAIDERGYPVGLVENGIPVRDMARRARSRQPAPDHGRAVGHQGERL
jgi:hypothetical protein